MQRACVLAHNALEEAPAGELQLTPTLQMPQDLRELLQM